MTKVAEIRKALNALADPKRAALLQGFFKTGPGEYGEGDVFAGLTVPQVRGLARRFRDAGLDVVPDLLASPLHEERLLALLLLVDRYKTDPDRVFALYVRSIPRINNWDLVDASAHQIVGAHDVGRAQLLRWAASTHVWTRRIAIVSTFHSIRAGRFEDTLAVAAALLGDPHDLLHKATGWMLREVGKRDVAALEGFLRRHHRRMPRTMLRYAIERFPDARRKAWLRGDAR
ncbi:MAG: DNA alkylation repair protein [Planctomycetaceae bacterium]|nr:DNA alkylation repair protein [Planctomycetaceae bacterium]